MFSRFFLSSVVGLSSMTFALVCASCGLSGGPGVSRKTERNLYAWHDDGGDGRVSIRISLSDQIAEFKRGELEIGWCYVATGKEGHDTGPGTYRIIEKVEDKHSNLYGWFEDEFGNVTNGDAKSRDRVPRGMIYVAAPMPHWMRLTATGIGMHGGLIPEPGKPASHGCIRLPKEFVAVLFDSVEVGTPVTITNGPSQRGQTEAASESRSSSGIGASSNRESHYNRGSDDGSAESVTYHNGVPVFYP